MDEPDESPYEETAAERAAFAESRSKRRGWFYYVAAFFLVLAGICFVLANNLKYVPGPLSPPERPSTEK